MNENRTNNLQFLAGGGEMGELIRQKDWSKTPIGTPENWPQSLRTTLSILLHSKFPMFLFWGKTHTCFYNDAYRPTLGNDGKHAAILGMNASEAWPEVWDFIKPLIDQVLAGGEATWFEDQLLPIYRNGKMEEVYWTFSHSAVNDETDAIAGVFLTCSETTNKVISLKKIEESEQRFRNVANNAPVMIWMSGIDQLFYFFNSTWINFTGRTMEQENGNGWTKGLHADDFQRCSDIYRNAFEKREEFYMEYRLRRHDGSYRWISDYGVPRFTSDGVFEGYTGACMDIHEKVTAQKTIKENEEKLNIIIAASNLAKWELNLKTREIHYSQRYLEILGYEKNTHLTHEQILKHLHPDDMQLRQQAFEESSKTGDLHYESRLIWNDNSIHWIQARGKIFYDNNNQPEKVIGVTRDITKEKRYEREVMESEQKFRLLADSMPQHIWTADTQGKLNYFNESVFEYSGFSSQQIDKLGWIDIVHPDDKPGNIAAWTHAIMTGTDFHYEHRFRRHDGEYRWQLSRAIPQKTADGTIQMWVGTSTDIQDQKEFVNHLEELVEVRTKELKKLNETLIKSEERYHLMVEEVQDYAILFLSPEGFIENWNLGAQKIKGYVSEEIVGKHLSLFYTATDVEKQLPQQLLEESRKIGKAIHEGWRVKKDGSLFWANVVITALHNEAGDVIGYSKLTHDLTEKKEAADKLRRNAEQLQQKNTELEQMNKELESFAYISSHDLQEPLRKIQTFSSRIVEKEFATLSEDAKDNFARMQNAAKRMQTLIEDLLAYSRTKNPERKYVKTPIYKIVEEVKEDLSEELERKNAILEIDANCSCHVIPFQFRQLLQNLISNSLKFSMEGVQPHIKIRSEIQEGSKLHNDKLEKGVRYCHVSVSDNGIGFDPQYSEKIFEVFQRLHGKGDYVGTGIGLAIVRKIADNHEAIVTATGQLGKGATFNIYIPIKK